MTSPADLKGACGFKSLHETGRVSEIALESTIRLNTLAVLRRKTKLNPSKIDSDLAILDSDNTIINSNLT